MASSCRYLLWFQRYFRKQGAVLPPPPTGRGLTVLHKLQVNRTQLHSTHILSATEAPATCLAACSRQGTGYHSHHAASTSPRPSPTCHAASCCCSSCRQTQGLEWTDRLPDLKCRWSNVLSIWPLKEAPCTVCPLRHFHSLNPPRTLFTFHRRRHTLPSVVLVTNTETRTNTNTTLPSSGSASTLARLCPRTDRVLTRFSPVFPPSGLPPSPPHPSSRIRPCPLSPSSRFSVTVVWR